MVDHDGIAIAAMTVEITIVSIGSSEVVWEELATSS